MASVRKALKPKAKIPRTEADIATLNGIPRRARKPARALLFDTSIDERRQSALKIAGLVNDFHLRDSQAAKLLGIALKDHSPKVRKAAAAALSVVSSDYSVPLLKGAVFDLNHEVRRTAVQALSVGKGYGTMKIAKLIDKRHSKDKLARVPAEFFTENMRAEGLDNKPKRGEPRLRDKAHYVPVIRELQKQGLEFNFDPKDAKAIKPEMTYCGHPVFFCKTLRRGAGVPPEIPLAFSRDGIIIVSDKVEKAKLRDALAYARRDTFGPEVSYAAMMLTNIIRAKKAR